MHSRPTAKPEKMSVPVHLQGPVTCRDLRQAGALPPAGTCHLQRPAPSRDSATCRDLRVWVRYNGIANNAVRGAFRAAGVRATSREHWNVLWGKAMKPSGYHRLHEQQRVSLTTCGVRVLSL